MVNLELNGFEWNWYWDPCFWKLNPICDSIKIPNTINVSILYDESFFNHLSMSFSVFVFHFSRHLILCKWIVSRVNFPNCHENAFFGIDEIGIYSSTTINIHNKFKFLRNTHNQRWNEPSLITMPKYSTRSIEFSFIVIAIGAFICVPDSQPLHNNFRFSEIPIATVRRLRLTD